MMPIISRFKTTTEFIKSASEFILNEALTAVTEKNNFILMLSGGSTPKTIYKTLLSSPYREQFPWDKTFFLLGDERILSSSDPNSNVYMLQQNLFIDSIVKKKNIILPEIDLSSPEASAKKYEQKLYKFFKDQDITIDLTLIGIGTDGHTASLFPEEYNNWVNNNNLVINTSQPCGDPSVRRISASLKLLNCSNHVLLLASGEEKRGIINQILEDITNRTNRLQSPLVNIKPIKSYNWFIN